MHYIFFCYKCIRQLKSILFCKLSSFVTKLIFIFNGINWENGLTSSGTPYIHISTKGNCTIGNNLNLGNWSRNSASGLHGKCKIEVRNGAVLTIGNNVGMTATTIICRNKITIMDNVMIGVGTHIYDTNFHNINPIDRIIKGDCQETVKTDPIIIHKNAFIGAFSIILKGVTIGQNSVIAAGSVVVKSIPNNQMWGGNPAKFIKYI